jgi:hypothetical protein
VENIIKYFHWNGELVSTEETIGAAIETEMGKFSTMHSYYNAVKDKEVVDFKNIDQREIHISFADITQKSFVNAVLNNGELIFDSASLTVDDTLLFVEGEKYQIAFALLGEDGTLVHIYRVDSESRYVSYAEEKTFTVTLKNAVCGIRDGLEGDYVLVAYIATEDGIRSSSYVRVDVSAIEGFPMDVYNTKISATLNADSGVTISYTKNMDFTTTVETEAWVGYDELYEIIASEIFTIGTPSDVLEFKNGETYTPITKDDVIREGHYRIAYTAIHEGEEKNGYVYFEYSARNKG